MRNRGGFALVAGGLWTLREHEFRRCAPGPPSARTRTGRPANINPPGDGGLWLREPGQRSPGIGCITGTRVGDSPEEGLRSLQVGRDEQEVVHQAQEQAARHGRAGLWQCPRSRGQVQSHFPQRTETKADLVGRGSTGGARAGTQPWVRARGNTPRPQQCSKPPLSLRSRPTRDPPHDRTRSHRPYSHPADPKRTVEGKQVDAAHHEGPYPSCWMPGKSLRSMSP